jgi:hypothetical protein
MNGNSALFASLAIISFLTLSFASLHNCLLPAHLLLGLPAMQVAAAYGGNGFQFANLAQSILANLQQQQQQQQPSSAMSSDAAAVLASQLLMGAGLPPPAAPGAPAGAAQASSSMLAQLLLHQQQQQQHSYPFSSQPTASQLLHQQLQALQRGANGLAPAVTSGT